MAQGKKAANTGTSTQDRGGSGIQGVVQSVKQWLSRLVGKGR